MANEFLQHRLEQLQRELATIEEIDSQTIESLERLVADYRRLLESSKSEAAAKPSEAASIREQLERMNSEHPLVMRLISQVTEGLASLGI